MLDMQQKHLLPESLIKTVESSRNHHGRILDPLFPNVRQVILVPYLQLIAPAVLKGSAVKCVSNLNIQDRFSRSVKEVLVPLLFRIGNAGRS